MDSIIQKAFETAEYMAVLHRQKQILKEEFAQNLLYYENGGSFTVTKELINFVKTLIDLGHTVDVVLVDDNNTPISISNLQTFFENIVSAYFEAVNSYYTKHNLLIKNRKVESLVNLNV
jgi:hypothetical protein